MQANSSKSTVERDALDHEVALRQTPLLGPMDPETARSLVAVMERQRYARGEVIFFEGSPGEALYLVVQGKVKLARTARDGRENLLSLLGVGDMLGELSVFDPGPRVTRAHVPEDTVVYELTRTALEAWLVEHPEANPLLLRMLAKRIRRTTISVADLVFTDVPGRVAKAILDLARRFGVQERSHLSVRHGLTQEELAQLVGASRETVNKALADFASRGWIDVHMGSVVVYEPDRLRARSR